MKPTKKILAMIMSITMLVGLVLTGCGKTEPAATTAGTTDAAETTAASSETTEAETEAPKVIPSTSTKHKIGVAFTGSGSEQTTQKEFLEKYIGPEYNYEFYFSEALTDVDALLTFIENAFAAGCEGIMNFQNSSVDAAVEKCEELGMYVVTNTSLDKYAESSLGIEHNLGSVGGSEEGVAKQYAEMVKLFTADGENHNFFISSAGAALNNVQHYDCTLAMLTSLEEIYDLKFSDSAENLARTAEPGELETGNPDVKIYLYPGYPVGDTFTSGVASVLQTGTYDVVMCCNQAYTKMTTTIDEVEKATGKNIILGGFDSIGASAEAVFGSTDSTGDSIMNACVIKPAVAIVGTMFAVLFNAINGENADAMKDNGKIVFFDNAMWLCENAEQYAACQKINTAPEYYELVIDDINEMICEGNDFNSINDYISQFSLDYLLEARGIK